MSELSEKLQAIYDNYGNAKELINTSETSATKTVAHLPVFRRLFPTTQIESFTEALSDFNRNLANGYCVARCSQNNSQCLAACHQYFANQLTAGHSLIRKIHKEYKIPAASDEDEE